MKKTKILIITLVILILTISTIFFIIDNSVFKTNKANIPVVSVEKTTSDVLEIEKDKKLILKAIKDVFDAYNSTDNTIITSVLYKYINPYQCKLVYNNIEAEMNSIIVNGIVIYKGYIDLRDNKFILGDNKFILGDYDIYVFSDKASITGNIDGSISISGKEVEKGPWKISCCMYKYGDNWFIGDMKLTKIDIIKLEYYPQLPDNYGKEPDEKWPLIVFLHGVGERGGTLDDVKKMNHSIPMMASTGKNFPFVAVSPLCPQSFSWKDLPYSINNMIDEVSVKYNIDTDRIYLTGLSMGGIGTWSIALQFPDKFAAIAPVCGSVNPDKVEKLKNLPIWAFHGAKDTIVPMDKEQRAVDSLKSCGGNIKYTVYPDVEHNAWNYAYTDKELYEWFLKHTRMKNKSKK